jgi:hypothetical protein
MARSAERRLALCSRAGDESRVEHAAAFTAADIGARVETAGAATRAAIAPADRAADAASAGEARAAAADVTTCVEPGTGTVVFVGDQADGRAADAADHARAAASSTGDVDHACDATCADAANNGTGAVTADTRTTGGDGDPGAISTRVTAGRNICAANTLRTGGRNAVVDANACRAAAHAVIVAAKRIQCGCDSGTAAVDIRHVGIGSTTALRSRYVVAVITVNTSGPGNIAGSTAHAF